MKDKLLVGAFVTLAALLIGFGVSRIKVQERQLCEGEHCVTVYGTYFTPNDSGCLKVYLDRELKASTTMCGTYQIK